MDLFAPDSGSIEEIETGLRWDSARLLAEIAGRQRTLLGRRFGRGSRIALVHGGSAHFFADLFAVWSIGGTAMCLDPGLTLPELKTVLAFAKPCAILARDAEHALSSSALGTDVMDLSSTTAAPGLLPAPAQSNPGDAALVLFTSGTTGAPKGVVLTFAALASRTRLNADIIGKGTLARTLLTLSTHFGHGLIGNALTPLLAGCDLIIPPSGLALARGLGQIIDQRGITFMTSVPAFWRMALRLSGRPAGNTLARIHVGSSPLSVGLWSDIVDWSRAEVVNCYGMTETANWFAGASSRETIAEGLVGKPWGGRAGIAASDNTIADQGEGEIVASSPSLMLEYLDRPDLTALALRDGWYFTGDRGRIDAEGRIWVEGRIKDEINRAGFKVQPEEIDRLLEAHPGVAEACVFGVPDSVSGEAVAAALTLKDGANVDADDLRSWCQSRLRREATPEHWFFVDKIPRSARGKLNRREVRHQVFGNQERLTTAQG